MICTSLHLYLQHEKGAGIRRTGTRYRRVPSEESTANTVANAPMSIHNAAIRAVARAGKGKDRSFNEITANLVMHDPVSVISLNGLSFPSPDDVIRPRHARR